MSAPRKREKNEVDVVERMANINLSSASGASKGVKRSRSGNDLTSYGNSQTYDQTGRDLTDELSKSQDLLATN